MANLPDWVSDIPEAGKWLAGTVAGLVGLVSGWGFLGMPIPATQAWTDRQIDAAFDYRERRDEIVSLEALIAKAENDEVRESLERRLAMLRAEIDDN